MSFLTAILVLAWLLIITSDLKPNTAHIPNQLPGQLVSTQIRTMGVAKSFLIHHIIDSVHHIPIL